MDPRTFGSFSIPPELAHPEAAPAQLLQFVTNSPADYRKAAVTRLRGLIDERDGQPHLKGSLDETFMVVSSLLAELKAGRNLAL
jgi:hypothetical protein